MKLVEPLGLLSGPAAKDAIASGLALPFMGGAFSMLRLIDDQAGPDHGRLVACRDLPDGWAEAVSRLFVQPGWAGLPDRPLVMGVLNTTPDSFSDGGRFADPAAAIAQGESMLADGVDIIDLGGESTRPGSSAVPPDVEQVRILPVVHALAASGAVISLDTRNASTMRAGIAAGARIVNDVSGLDHDPDAAATVATLGCDVVLMHMRGTPGTMGGLTRYRDLAVDVVHELAGRLDRAERAGIARARIALDPGLGFAKAGAQNAELLHRLPLLFNLGCPLLIGASRKRFVGDLTGEAQPLRRGPGSLAAHLFALSRGARIIRTHDVPETVQAIRMWQELQGWVTTAKTESEAPDRPAKDP